MNSENTKDFKWSYKILLILAGVIILKILEAVILQRLLYWLLKIHLDGIEVVVNIITVFIIIAPFTFIVWKQRSRLQEAERRYKVLADNSLVGIYTYYAGKFRYVNRRFLEKTGYKREEIIGHDFHKLIVPEDHPILMESIQKWMEGKKEASGIQLRALKKDKTIMDIELYGTVEIRNGKPILMGSILDISERKRHEKLLNEFAFCDPLTGLANRRSFESDFDKLINDTIKKGKISGILLLDLDDFKQVNDTFGHEAGDYVLKELANRLLSCIRKEDTAVRFAGDEFIVLLPDIEKSSAIKIAQRILKEINTPFTFHQKQINTSISIGAAFIPELGRDPKTLISLADKAMYEAKKQGKNTYHIYNRNKILS